MSIIISDVNVPPLAAESHVPDNPNETAIDVMWVSPAEMLCGNLVPRAFSLA